jgi:5-methylcytosine-specific restriction enzyme A
MPSRGTAAQRGYTHRWQVARRQHLSQQPLCVMCQQQGRITPATVVDHIVPHRLDPALFWDRANWQSLCAPCHDGPKHSQEVTGRVRGADKHGVPLDPAHHWATP